MSGEEAVAADAMHGRARVWWQWVLLYPTLAIALVTAAPKWVDGVLAAYHGVRTSSFAEASRQNDMWRRNLSCAAAPFSWYNNPSNIKVDATICDSGDIFIRAMAPQRGQFYKWVPVDDILALNDEKGSFFESAAKAAIPMHVDMSPESAAVVFPVQFGPMINVLCQRFVAPGRLLRRMQTPQGCEDQLVDTFNNFVIQRMPVPCAPC